MKIRYEIIIILFCVFFCNAVESSSVNEIFDSASQWPNPPNGGISYSPHQVTFDSLNNVYILDSQWSYGNSRTGELRILKFDTEGNLLKEISLNQDGYNSNYFHIDNEYKYYVGCSTYVNIYDQEGTKLKTIGNGERKLDYVSGVTTDSTGNILIADGLINIFDKEGNFKRSFGSGSDHYVAYIDPDGTIYCWGDQLEVYDKNYNLIRNFNFDYIYSGVLSIAIDPSMNIYTCGRTPQQIYVYKYHLAGDTLVKDWVITNDTDWDNHGGEVGILGVDRLGNVYLPIGESEEGYYSGSVLIFSSSGDLIKTWKTSSNELGEFNYPLGLMVDTDNKIFVVDSLNSRIQKFDSSGKFILSWGGPYASSDQGKFYHPSGIAKDNEGNIYIADTKNYRVEKFDSSGNYILKWGDGATGAHGPGIFDSPTDVSVDVFNNVYVKDANGVQKFNSVGDYLYEIDRRLDPTLGIATDSFGNLLILGWGDHDQATLEKYDATGNFINEWDLGWSFDIWNSLYYENSGITIDREGFIYITDIVNDRIVKLDQNGNYISEWGKRGSNLGEFLMPTKIAVDNNGSIYVADSGNHRIQKFSKVTDQVPPLPQVAGLWTGTLSLDSESPPYLNNAEFEFIQNGDQISGIYRGYIQSDPTYHILSTIKGKITSENLSFCLDSTIEKINPPGRIWLTDGCWEIPITEVNPTKLDGTWTSASTIHYGQTSITKGEPSEIRLDSITPAFGYIGTTVPITNLSGSGFVNGISVYLTKSGSDNITATGVSIINSKKITCEFNLPLGIEEGFWNVVVKNPDGKISTLTNGFTVSDPSTALPQVAGLWTGTLSLDSESPPYLNNAEFEFIQNGDQISGIYRGYIQSDPTYHILSTIKGKITSENLSFCLESTIEKINPAGRNWLTDACWEIPITEVNPTKLNGTWTSASTIHYGQTSITKENLSEIRLDGITPAFGYIGTTVPITNLSGYGFVNGTTVYLTKSGSENIAATGVSIINPNKITCEFTLPLGIKEGNWNVVVKNLDGKNSTLMNGFTVTTSSSEEKIPVILVHGWHGSPETWTELENRLSSEGIPYYVFDYARGLPPLGPINFQAQGDPRIYAQELEDKIDQLKSGDEPIIGLDNSHGYSGKFDIVCHSMGALVSRYYIENLGGRDNIRQWIGIAPANHGSAIADGNYGIFRDIFGGEAARELMTDSQTVQSLSENVTDDNIQHNVDIKYRVLVGVNTAKDPSFGVLRPHIGFLDLFVDKNFIELGKTRVMWIDDSGDKEYGWTYYGDGAVATKQSALIGANLDYFVGLDHSTLPKNSVVISSIITYLKNPDVGALTTPPNEIDELCISPLKPMVGGQITFNAYPSVLILPNGNIGTVKWVFDDGAWSEDARIPHLYTNPKSYKVTLELSDDTGQINRKYKDINLSLELGDILLDRSGGWPGTIVPGYWSHAGMYIGNNKVIESLSDGVVITDISTWFFPTKTYVGVYRVKGLSPETRQNVVNFALSKENHPYDKRSLLFPPSKQLECNWLLIEGPPGCNYYYCSELIWAAYLKAANINLDSVAWGDAIAPEEIDNPIYTEFIGSHFEDCPVKVSSPLSGWFDCNIDVIITDPEGRILSKFVNEIPNSFYGEEDLDNDSVMDDYFCIPEPLPGDYSISVLQSGAILPNETYSLHLSIFNSNKEFSPITLVNESKIIEIDNNIPIQVAISSKDNITFIVTPHQGPYPLVAKCIALSLPDNSSNVWSFGDGTFAENVTEITHTYPSPGNYTVTLTVSWPDGEDSTSQIIQVIGAPVPPISIKNLHNSTYLKDTITWTWTDPSSSDFDHVMVYLNGAFQGNVTKGTQVYPAAGLSPSTAYTIGTRTVGNTGLVNSTWVNQTATTAPDSDPGIIPPEAQFISNTTSGTAPLTVQFNDSSSGTVTSYEWDFGDGANSTEQNPVHTYTNYGTYNVSLTVTNAAGEDTITKNDYIQVIPMVCGDTGYYLIHCNVEGAEVYFDQDSKGVITDGTLLVKIYLTATPYHRYSVSKAGYVTINEALPSYPAKDQTKDIFVTLVKVTDDSWTRPPYPEVTKIQPGYPDTNWTRPPYPEVTKIQPGYPDTNWTRPPYPEVTKIQPGYPDTNWTRPPYPEVTKIQPGYPDTNWTRPPYPEVTRIQPGYPDTNWTHPPYLDWLWNRPSIKNFLKDIFG